MAQVTITAIKRTPRMSKAGRAFVSLGLKTNEYGDKWLSGFAGDENKDWKVGDTVEIEVEQKDEYLNFKTLRVNAVSKAQGDDSRVFNLINLKILPLLEFMAEDLKALRKREISYPEMDETNDAHGLEIPAEHEIDASDSPF